MEEWIKEARKQGPIAEAEAVSRVERLKRWFLDVFKNIKSVLSKWSGKDLKKLTLEDFNRMTIRDFMEGLNPNKEMWRGEAARNAIEANPMRDDYHTGVRGREDVKAFDEILKGAEEAWNEDGALMYPDMDIEMLRKAKQTGKITAYSSKPIEDGAFVTPSRMNAKDYAGDGKVYSKEVSIDDVAWIDESEGQLATGSKTKNAEQFDFSKDRAEFDAMRERAVAEGGIVMPDLAGKEVEITQVPRHDFEGSGKEALKKAEAWAKDNLSGVYKLTDASGASVDYTISNKAIEKYVSPSATGKSANIGVHLSVLKELPNVIANSIEAEVHPDYPKNDRGERDASLTPRKDTVVHRFYGAVEVDGETYRVKTTILESPERNKSYSYEVSEIEILNSKEPSISVASTKDNNPVVGANIQKRNDNVKSEIRLLDSNEPSKMEPTARELPLSHGIANVQKRNYNDKSEIETLDARPSAILEPKGQNKNSTLGTANVGTNSETRKISGKELLNGVGINFWTGKCLKLMVIGEF